jgi:hypothetical protein
MMFSKTGVLFVAVACILLFAGSALASPPVPPPTEGFGIVTETDVEVRGDFSHDASLNWTWMHDTDPNGGSTLAYPGVNQALAAGGRAGQIRYMNEVDALDGYVQFKKTFELMSNEEPNLDVSKDFGYIASDTSLIASA